MKKLPKLRALASSFFQNRSGNFGLTTAFILVPLLVVAGGSLDVSMAFLTKTDMQNLADSAALAGGALYDGTNSTASIAMAKSFLKSYKLPDGATYSVTMDGQTLQVAIAAKSPNVFLPMAGIGIMDVKVLSEAIAPMKPKSVTFTPTKSQGYYYKKVTIRVIRPNSAFEEIVGTVEYRPKTHDNNGQGTMEVSPSTSIVLGKYTSLILQMEIKEDGCSIRERANINGSKVSCDASTRLQDRTYDLTLRTDNPDTSQYLFVDGKQLPKGVTSPLSAILVCGKTSNHAWEDGGGWERQDFFYTAYTVCAPDGQFVRLTK